MCFFLSSPLTIKELCIFILNSYFFIMHRSDEFKVWSTNQLLIPQNSDIDSNVVAALEIQCVLKI